MLLADVVRSAALVICLLELEFFLTSSGGETSVTLAHYSAAAPG